MYSKDICIEPHIYINKMICKVLSHTSSWGASSWFSEVGIPPILYIRLWVSHLSFSTVSNGGNYWFQILYSGYSPDSRAASLIPPPSVPLRHLSLLCSLCVLRERLGQGWVKSCGQWGEIMGNEYSAVLWQRGVECVLAWLTAGPPYQSCGMLETKPSLSFAPFPLPQPPATGATCWTGSAGRSWDGEGSPGYLSQILSGSWSWGHW